MAEIGRRGWRASLVLPDIEEPSRAPAGTRLRDMLFVPRDGGKPRERLPGKELSAFRTALAEERARYGGSLSGGLDAAAPA
jgi:hypothetical protein